MHKKKENLFPTFLQLYLRQVLLFYFLWSRNFESNSNHWFSHGFATCF